MHQPFFKFKIPAFVMIVVASTAIFSTMLTVASTAIFSTKSALSSSKKIKLVYFDAKGVVEMTRIMLKIGGLEFEDSRFSIKVKEGGGFETPEFALAKETGVLKANMDRAPVLMVGDTSIGQSKAIERYVAKMCNLMGAGDEEFAVIDCIAEHTRDIKEKWGKIRSIGGMSPSPEKEAATKKWFEEGEFKDWLIKLESSLPEQASKDGFCVGSSTSYADLNIWHLLRDNFDAQYKTSVEESAKDCATLNIIADRVGNIPELKQWLQDRPKTMF